MTEWANKILSILSTRSTAFIKIVVVCIVISIILIAYESHYDDTKATILPTISSIRTSERDSKTFYVDHYNLSNDYLKLLGHYGKREINSSSTIHKTVLHLEGVESLLHQIKPQMLLDKKLLRADLPFERYFKVNRKVKHVNCNKLFKDDENEVKRAKELMMNDAGASEQITAEEYLNMTTNCSNFITSRGYIMSSLTKIEENFPIAFSMLMYKDIWQFERLLRAIYRPQNLYCLHVDAKTNDATTRAVTNIANCFENVFLASKRFDVQWGTMSVLEPELACMQDLWNRSKAWNYFINLTGQEFPLRTNYELVQILTAYNGANDVEGTIETANRNRWAAAGVPPHGLIPVKGSVHVVVSRGYVDAVLHDPKIADFLNWTRKTLVPDEVFFATINHNPTLNVPGSYRGLPETDTKVKPFVARFKNWGVGLYNWPCAGKRVRAVCIFGIGDLPLLVSRKELFANKFYFDYQRFALDCMEELLFNHTRDEYLGKLVFDSRWYSKLGFVLNKVDT